MIVVVLTACPEGLRGVLTRWLMEVSAGVFVGNAGRRVRDHLWERVIEMAGNGRALMAYSSSNEQGFDIQVHGHHWIPEDFEGITLMRRPVGLEGSAPPAPSGWSSAARRRKYGRR